MGPEDPHRRRAVELTIWRRRNNKATRHVGFVTLAKVGDIPDAAIMPAKSGLVNINMDWLLQDVEWI